MENEKRILVTGASGGIGFAITKAVLEAGYSVVAHYNSHAEKLKELAETFSDKIQLMQFYKLADWFVFFMWEWTQFLQSSH